MEKVFEDQFMDIQSDMVALCLEYLGNYADKVESIYVYCSKEHNSYTCGYFFRIEGKMVQREEVSRFLPNIDDSSAMQFKILDILKEDLFKIEEVCQKHEQPMPTEIKIEYSVTKNSLEFNCQYDSITNAKGIDKSPGIIEDEWFESLK